jgi:hypothetical protein
MKDARALPGPDNREGYQMKVTVSAEWMRVCWGLSHPVEMQVIEMRPMRSPALGREFVVDYQKRHWVVFEERCDSVTEDAAKPATFEQSKAKLAAITSTLNRASDALRPFPKGPMGLTPDAVKFSPEFRAAKAAYDAAFQALRDHNGFMVKTFAAEMRAERKRPRKAYDIVFRCTLNGCDWTSRLWLRDETEAFEVMYKRLAYGSRGAGEGKFRYSRDFYRVVSCDVSADQSRPVIS